VHLDASPAQGFSGASAINLVTGAEWTMKGECARSTHLGVPAFDLDDRDCYLETTERLPYCGASYGYTTATWLDWRDDGNGFRTLHQPNQAFITTVMNRQTALGTMGTQGFRSAGYDIDTSGWSLVVAVAQDTDCAADGGVGGTTTFFVGTPTQSPRAVGIADRSPASGRFTLYFGGRGHGPGKLAETWAWNRALSLTEVQALWSETHAKFE